MRSRTLLAERRSSSAAKLNNPPPVPFRWPVRWKHFKVPRCPALGRGLLPHLFAGLSLAIKLLRLRRRPTHLAHSPHLPLEVPAILTHMQHVTYTDLACRLGGLSIRANPRQIARLFR